jgi:predicted 3-demethylubiquinone-9 3-methyltransferase (glyoxalase superfamily)
MPAKIQRITPCLWFDDQAEAAVKQYTAIFPNSRVLKSSRYSKEGAEVSGRPQGSVLAISFTLDGVELQALNGGPVFKFNEAVSLVVNCESQREVDHYWARLSEGGDPSAHQCGWLKDRFGLSWQIVPTMLGDLLADPDPEKAAKAMAAMLKMKKLDIAELERAVA